MTAIKKTEDATVPAQKNEETKKATSLKVGETILAEDMNGDLTPATVVMNDERKLFERFKDTIINNKKAVALISAAVGAATLALIRFKNTADMGEKLAESEENESE